MRSNFSEFSYGYAVTEELITGQRASMLAAPIFPSLYEEGQSEGGYDVEIPPTSNGIPVFLQFKLSDYLQRKNSREHRQGLIKVPYYRMHLRPTRLSDQHNLLLKLERSGKAVFYIAPEFHLVTELNNFYVGKTITLNSAIFSPQDIGPLPDDDAHYIAFKHGASVAYRCSSNPKEINKISFLDGLPAFLMSRDIQSISLDETNLNKLAEEIFEILVREKEPIEVEGIRQVMANHSPAQSIRYMVRTFFDAEVFIFFDIPKHMAKS